MKKKLNLLRSQGDQEWVMNFIEKQKTMKTIQAVYDEFLRDNVDDLIMMHILVTLKRDTVHINK